MTNEDVKQFIEFLWEKYISAPEVGHEGKVEEKE
jgi:hypothetical protein